MVLTRPELFRGKLVLELGSGAGFCGLCLLRKATPSKLQLTDYASDVLQNLTHNLTINGHAPDGDALQVATLDWENFDLEKLSFLPEVIVAADVVYDPGLARSFVRILRQLLRRKDSSGRHPIALVASTIRNPSTYAAFEKQLLAHETPLHTFPVPSIEVPSLLDYRRDTHRICWISASPFEQLPPDQRAMVRSSST